MRSNRVGSRHGDDDEAEPFEEPPRAAAFDAAGERAEPGLRGSTRAVPSTTSRRWPKRSAVSAIAMPPSAVDQVDSRQQPAGLAQAGAELVRIDGREGGTLPTWKAATMPAATSSADQPPGRTRRDSVDCFLRQRPLAYKAGPGP